MDLELENIITAAMTLTAGVLLAISVRAYTSTRSPKVLLLASAFALFFIKGLVLSIGLFTTRSWGRDLLPSSVTFDLAILILFYFAVVKRNPR